MWKMKTNIYFALRYLFSFRIKCNNEVVSLLLFFFKFSLPLRRIIFPNFVNDYIKKMKTGKDKRTKVK